MTPDDTLSLYLLARSLWWRHDLEQLDAEAVAAVISALEAAQKDIASRLAAESAGLATLSDWRREQDEALNAWADEVLAGARATITGTVSEASIAAAAASLAAYNAILTLDGKASAVKSVGLTSTQIASWFQDTALGSGGLEHWVDTALDNGVKQSILAALRQVAVEGKGTAEAVRRVLVAASDAGFELTRREAITITRTFIQTANVNAQEAVYTANEGLFKGYKRVETLDNRTCIQCFTGETEISTVGEVLGVSKRKYTGEIVVITTAAGQKLAGTPNHPILTPDGWLPLDKFKPGQQVINAASFKGGCFAGTNYIGVPTPFSKFHDSFCAFSAGKVSLVTSSCYDFHGDGMRGNENINAHDTALFLRDDVNNTCGFEAIKNDKLTFVNGSGLLFAKCELLKLMFTSLESFGLTSKLSSKISKDRIEPELRPIELLAYFIGADSAVEHSKCTLCRNFTVAAPVASLDVFHNPKGDEEFCHCGRRNTVFDGKSASGSSRSIFVDNVVDVRRETRSCHVYNLQSCLGIYIAGGVIVKNCALADGAEYALNEPRPRLPVHPRCRGMWVPVAKSWRDFGIDVDDLEAVARPWTIRETGPIGTGGRKIENYGKTTENFSGWWASLSDTDKAKTAIGPVRRRLLETGAVMWDQMWDKASGLPLTLEQMGYDRQGNRL